MKYLVLLVAVLVFFNCSSTPYVAPSFETSNQYLLEKTVYNLPVDKVVREKLSTLKSIAVVSLEKIRTTDNPITSLVEDQLISRLTLSGYSCIDRDDDSIDNLLKESTNEHYSIIPDYQSRFRSDTTKFISAFESKISSADYLLAYRILECGIMYRKLKESRYVGRECRVRIHIRLIDSNSGEILIAGPLSAKSGDKVLRESLPYLQDYHYQFYSTDLPMQQKTEKFEEYPTESKFPQTQK